ncbi:NUDIX hydrolase [Candidatus Woesearchaeota archaeon]|nr:NUDIX hydrolase [Candidatus Woesearchaeota archaeon]
MKRIFDQLFDGDLMTTQQIGVKAIIEKNGKVLLIRRSSKYEHLTDAWDIPGGRLEFGEEPEAGLQREIQEETGLELDEIKQILDATTVFKNEEKQIVRITYLCTVKETNQTGKISDEHTSLEWIPKEKLKTLELKDKILKKVIDKHFQ